MQAFPLPRPIPRDRDAGNPTAKGFDSKAHVMLGMLAYFCLSFASGQANCSWSSGPKIVSLDYFGQDLLPVVSQCGDRDPRLPQADDCHNGFVIATMDVVVWCVG